MSPLTTSQKAIVAAIIVHEAKRRIPAPYRKTFFSEHDVWLYQAVMDDRTCAACSEMNRYSQEHGGFIGLHLRAYFPYLEIESENRIKANVHPNCRCYLTRKSAEKPKEPFIWVDSQGRHISIEDRERYKNHTKQIFDEIPAWDKAGIDEIAVKFEIDPERPRVMGRYMCSATLTPNVDYEAIYIKTDLLESEPTYDEKLTINHEVGHHVWNKLSGEEQASWIQFWRDNQLSMPTTYAKTRPEEGFCECYAYLRYNVWSCDSEVRKWFTKPWFKLSKNE